jgi:hypothetical protein
MEERGMNEIIFGGIYKHNDNLKNYLPKYFNSLNDQRQGFWFPIRVFKEDGSTAIYMVDTYQFDMPYEYQKDYSKMIEFLKSLGIDRKDNIRYANNPFSYYYSARVEITEKSIEAFDLLANLEDYIIIREEEARYYNTEDIIYHVSLWNYHNSGRGIILKRKNAKVNYELKIDNLINDALHKSIYRVGINTINSYYVEKVLECVREANETNSYYNNNKVVYLLTMQKYLNKVSANYERYEKKIREGLTNKEVFGE